MDFDFGKTIGIMLRTMPFIFFRMAVYFGIALAYAVSIGVGGGAGYVLDRLTHNAGFTGWGVIFGFGICSAALYWAREYLLYLVKAGHIAVMVEMIDGRELPAGNGQISYAQAKVKERFKETSVLFGVDQLIKGILRAVHGMLFTIGAFLPIPGLSSLLGFFDKMLNMALTYTDEVILAYNIRTKSDNPWASSRTALILYAQNFKAILKNAFFLMLISYGVAILVFFAILAPAAAIALMLHAQGGIWVYLIAGIFAWALKAALLEPFAICALMQVFFKVTEGQTPDPEWEQKLSSLSDKFRKLGDKAREHLPTAPSGAARTAA